VKIEGSMNANEEEELKDGELKEYERKVLAQLGKMDEEDYDDREAEYEEDEDLRNLY